jgi:hypothetical protein
LHVTFGEIERGSVDDDDDDYASTIFGRFPGCYALLVKSALAGNMGFAVALGKAILVHMYVLRVLYSSGVHYMCLVIGGRLVEVGWCALLGVPCRVCRRGFKISSVDT